MCHHQPLEKRGIPKISTQVEISRRTEWVNGELDSDSACDYTASRNGRRGQHATSGDEIIRLAQSGSVEARRSA